MGWRELLVDESGQDLIEVSLLMALAVIAVVAALPTGSEAIAAICTKTGTNLDRGAAAASGQ